MKHLAFNFFLILAFIPVKNEEASLAFLPVLAAAFTAATGLFGAVSSYRAGQQQADLAEQQAEINAEMARREAEADAREESEEMRRLRDQQRRRRAQIEAAYAKSGVLLEGTPAEMLTRQRETDEFNVQSRHYEGNERRKTMLWSADQGKRMGGAQASAMRRRANSSFISGIGNTAASSYGNYKMWSQ